MADDARGPSKHRVRWRPWLRAIHRDAGYLAVGITFIYAVSGIAVNHLTDFSDGDPSFRTYQTTHEVGPVPGDDPAAADAVRSKLGITEAPTEIYRSEPNTLDILFDKRTLHVDTSTGHVVEDGQKPRFFLRVANWLHLNRGKKAWTYVADAYAFGLLLLATSGMFMIAGKKGFLGRGVVLVALGIAIPVVYVTLAGP